MCFSRSIIGAGSFFTRRLCTDILNIPGLEEGVFGLVDIDPGRLDINARLVRKIISLTGRKGWRVQAHTDRRRVMPASDYLVCTIEVAGEKGAGVEREIPKRYGIMPSVGDTLGPGGVMKALRTWPALRAVLKDAGRLCPKALLAV